MSSLGGSLLGAVCEAAIGNPSVTRAIRNVSRGRLRWLNNETRLSTVSDSEGSSWEGVRVVGIWERRTNKDEKRSLRG
jgi:hypothetical protein